MCWWLGGERGKAVVLVDGGAKQKGEGGTGGIKASVVAAGTKGYCACGYKKGPKASVWVIWGSKDKCARGVQRVCRKPSL